MLGRGPGIAVAYLLGARSSLQWSLRTKNIPFRCAAIATASRRFQINKEQTNENDELRYEKVSSIIKSGAKTNSPQGVFEIIKILADLVEGKKVDFQEDIKKDENFSKLLSKIEVKEVKMNPQDLLKGLKDLHRLGLSPDSYTIRCTENQLLWCVRTVTIPLVVSIFLFLLQNQTTPMKKKVLKETIRTIQRRWVEVKGANEIRHIYAHYDSFNLDFLGKLDDRTIEEAENMNYSHLSVIFCGLATGKRRATPVLRALAFHMAKQEDELPPKQLSNILYAMHTLSFPDLVLLEKIGKDLISQVAEIDRPSIIGSILYTMGQMKWRQEKLLEVILEWVEKNIDHCRINHLVSLVLTLATVAYTPTNAESLFEKLNAKLTLDSVTKEAVWLDIVWSLALIGRATNDQITSVLHPAFVSKTTSDAQELCMGMKLKLLNINAITKLTMPSYDGPQLDLSSFQDLIITQNRNELMLSKHVQSTLNSFLPPTKYVRENVQTPMGFIIHCELIMDQKGRPLPIQNYSKSFGDWDSAKPLPAGVSKLALFVWDYKAYTIGNQELLGINQLAVQLSEKSGYKVVHIPHFEYNMRAQTIKNVQYLDGKIKAAAGVS